MADGSHLLPDDIWCIIGEKLEVAADRIRFRSVCRSWRCLVPFPQPPWLMLAEDLHNPDFRGFFGLGQQQSDEAEQQQQQVHQFQLPEVYQTRCFGSQGTWLITIDLQERICLLNPFSRVQFHLPHQTTFEFGPEFHDEISPKDLRDGVVKKAIMVPSPPSSSDGRDCIVVVIFYYVRKLAYARPGDPVWTTLPTPVRSFQDIIFYQNQIYGINRLGQLMCCSLGDDLNPPSGTLLADHFIKQVNDCKNTKYLVEWMGELLFVLKFMDDVYDGDDYVSYQLNRFEIYKFDFDKKEWDELNNLGEYSLFLGFNTSVAVLASRYPGLIRNCIYYTDDYTFGYAGGHIPGGGEMGVFDLEEKKARKHYKGESTSIYSPPVWIVPQYHP